MAVPLLVGLVGFDDYCNVPSLGGKAVTPRKISRKGLVNKLDFAWRQLVKVNGYCERCGRRDRKLDAHHYFGRVNRRLRWDPRNGIALCGWECHYQWAEQYPSEFTDWMRANRPEDAAYCERVAHETTHYSDSDLLEILADLQGSLEREAA